MGLPVRAVDQAVLTGFELDFSVDGVRRRRPLQTGWDVRFEAAEPVREFTWHKYGRGFAGWYYSVTVRDHVGYESWLERDRLVLLDRDSQVTATASQPFWLHWHDGVRERRHAPDYFVRLADGRARVVDVRAEDEMDEETRESFAATERACGGGGMGLRLGGAARSGVHGEHPLAGPLYELTGLCPACEGPMNSATRRKACSKRCSARIAHWTRSPLPPTVICRYCRKPLFPESTDGPRVVLDRVQNPGNA